MKLDRLVCVLMLVLFVLTPVTAVPNILQSTSNLSRLEAIRVYFNDGLRYMEIIVFLLLSHGIKLSLRQLKRILKTNGLYRNKHYSREADVKDLVSVEIENSGRCIGYRAMWRRLINDYHVRVPRDKVLQIMRDTDPEGVRRRKAHRLGRTKVLCQRVKLCMAC